MRQRVFALGLIAISGWLAFLASGYVASFSYEPVGPRAFPWLLLGGLALAGVYLLITGKKQDEDEEVFLQIKKLP